MWLPLYNNTIKSAPPTLRDLPSRCSLTHHHHLRHLGEVKVVNNEGIEGLRTVTLGRRYNVFYVTFGMLNTLLPIMKGDVALRTVTMEEGGNITYGVA